MTKKKERNPKQERMRRATKNLKQIEEKLAPFVRKTRHVNTSTAGEWQEDVGWLGGTARLGED